MTRVSCFEPIASAAGRWRRIGSPACAGALALLLLAGCADTRYYWQSVNGHIELMRAAKPVEQWLADAQAPEALKERLLLSRRMREFAVTELALPDNSSYRRYADLQRPAVVWNVVAAAQYSLTLKTWCFPMLGCVGYRGYFSEAEARQEARQLEAQGLEVSVYGVPAYSTLGWMNWAGGDPLLNTFIYYPEGDLARTIFHELAHQVLYLPDDTTFNESFATAVEQAGVERWLASFGSARAREDFAVLELRRQQFRALALATRERLHEIYQAPVADGGAAQMGPRKAAAMQQFRDEYARLKVGWGGYSGYDQWVASANNASFAAQAAYDELVPAFAALFERENRNWGAFYDAVGKLAKLPPSERARVFKELGAGRQGRIELRDDTGRAVRVAESRPAPSRKT